MEAAIDLLLVKLCNSIRQSIVALAKVPCPDGLYFRELCISRDSDSQLAGRFLCKSYAQPEQQTKPSWQRETCVD
jgi:hypothetical protein